MAVAQGLVKKTVFAKQSALGTPATTGGQVMRRTNSVFGLSRDSYENNEIVSHQQSTGATAGIGKTAGKLDGLISPGTYSKLFGSLLRKDFAATTAITGLTITPAGSGPTYTLTRSAGDFLVGGIKVFDIVRLTAGVFNAANLNKNLVVTGVTATVLTVMPLNGVALIAESAVSSATLTVMGKKSIVPLTGHTNDYYTVEEVYTDLTKAEQFNDVKVAKADITIPATGNATVSFDCPGLSRTRVAQTISSPTAETTSSVCGSVNGLILVNGVVTPVTGAQFSIDGKIAPGEAEVGSNAISDHIRGSVSVSGTFTAKFRDSVIQDVFDSQADISIFLPVATSKLATAEFVSFACSALNVFSDDADDGQAKEIIRTYRWVAKLNGSGGAALANDQTIVSIQDSLAA